MRLLATITSYAHCVLLAAGPTTQRPSAQSLTLARHTTAYQVTDTAAADSARLYDDLRRALADLADAELAIASRLDNEPTERGRPQRQIPAAEHERRAAAVTRARALLDTAVLERPWGHAALDRLRYEYPVSVLLDRYDAVLAMRDGRLDAALARYEALLRRSPADVELQRGRGAALERLGRPADAIAAYERALELSPEDTATYPALLGLHAQRATVDELLAQVRRLRVRLPDSAPLRDHEIELLHRLGRLDEAAALAGKQP